MNVKIATISESDILSFRACLDAVARERKYLALLEAPPLEQMRSFVSENIARKVPQFVAKDAECVVGWCDILPAWHDTLQHCGSVGMGLLPGYRGQGIGRRLLAACLGQAQAIGITRIELEAREDNLPALGLYKSMGFVQEGKKRRGMKVDGQCITTVAMCLLLGADA